MELKCENCGGLHAGSFGSGRFCSERCRRSYSSRKGYFTKIKNGTFTFNLKGCRHTPGYGTWKCAVCGSVFESRRKLQAHRKSAHGVERGQAWNKGLTAETSETVRRIAEKNKVSMKGRSHTVSAKTREKLSEIRSLALDANHGGFQDVGWYKAKNLAGDEFTVRGTWELTIAELLNAHGILWERNRCLKYTLDGVKKTYNPDFHLPATNEYIEVKGYYSNADKRKMQSVLEHNPGVRIYMVGMDVFPLFKQGRAWLSEKLVLKPE